MENQSISEADSQHAKIAALEARLEQLELSTSRLEAWKKRIDAGEQSLKADILMANGLMLNFEGKSRVWLMATENGAEFCLYDGDEQTRVNIAVDSSDENGTFLSLYGEGKRPLTPQQQELESKGAKHRRQHEEVVRLSFGPDGGLLALFDNDANPRVVARANAESGSVATTNQNGQILAALLSGAEGGQLHLLPDTWQESEAQGTTPVVGVRLEARTEGGAILVRDHSATGAVALLAVREQNALLMMGDENCAHRVALSAAPGISAFQLRHSDESPSLMLAATPSLGSVELKAGNDQTLGEWLLVSDPANPTSQQCELSLQDSQGQHRLRALATDGVTSLKFNDENGVDRLSMLVGGQASALSVADTEGTQRLLIQADPTFLVRDREKRVVAMLDTTTGGRLSLFAPPSPHENLELVSEDEVAGETPDGTTEILQRGSEFLGGPATRQRVTLAAVPEGAGLILHGGTSEEQMRLSVGENASHLQIKDREGTPHLNFGSTPGGGNLTLHNDAGAVRLALGVKDDSGALALLRSGGELDALLTADEDGGQLVLFDEHGERSATLPDVSL